MDVELPVVAGQHELDSDRPRKNLTERLMELRRYRRETSSIGTPPMDVPRYRDLADWLSEMRNRAVTGDLKIQTMAILSLSNVQPERRALRLMRAKIINQERLEARVKHLTKVLEPLAGQKCSVDLAPYLLPTGIRYIERCVGDASYREALEAFLARWHPLDLMIQGRHLDDLLALSQANAKSTGAEHEDEDISGQPKIWKPASLADVMGHVGRARQSREFALYFENVGLVLLKKIVLSGSRVLCQSVSGKEWVFEQFDAMTKSNFQVYAAVANNTRTALLFFVHKSQLLPENLIPE